MSKILICKKCEEYTLFDTCKRCGEKTANSEPSKYSVDDKYAKYRREAKKAELEDKGLLKK